MNATRSIRHDHDLLRKRVALLESALQVAPETRFVLREMCFSLHRLLQDHINREAQSVRRYTDRLSGGDPLPHVRDHAETLGLLRSVNELLLGGMRASMPTVSTWLVKAIEQLKSQMSEQESRLFPVLEEAETEEAQEPTTILGTMSVNEILQRYPQTEQLFRQLHINRVAEGYKSVDELAWSHGVDVGKFLEQLRQAVTESAAY
jgi:hypothetical protein